MMKQVIYMYILSFRRVKNTRLLCKHFFFFFLFSNNLYKFLSLFLSLFFFIYIRNYHWVISTSASPNKLVLVAFTTSPASSSEMVLEL